MNPPDPQRPCCGEREKLPKIEMSGFSADLMSVIRQVLLAATLVASALVLQPLAAQEESAFSLQGFGTLGMARSTTDDVQFVRDLSQARGVKSEWNPKIDSVLGVQANWRVTTDLEAVAQVMTRYGAIGNFKPELSWAFARYNPTPNFSLRAGRLGTDFFMMADSRWVGYSYLTVRPPGDYFMYLPFYSIHGGDVSYTLQLGDGLVRGKAFYGHSNGQVPLANLKWDIEGSPMLGAYLDYLYGAWQVRASYANIRFEHDLPLAPLIKQLYGFSLTADQSRFLATEGTRTHYYSLGLVFDQGPWLFQLMLNAIRQGTNALESSSGGYAIGGYRVKSVTPYLGYSWVRSTARNRMIGGNPVENFVTNYVMEDGHSDQQTFIVGARWDVAKNTALKAQWDAIRGNRSSYLPYRAEDRSRWDGSTNIFSLTLDFVF